MRTHFLVGTILVLGSVLLAQTVPPTAPSEPQAAPATPATSAETEAYLASLATEMQPSPSWHPGPDFLKNAHAACDNSTQPPSFADCFIDQMPKAGAPAEAVKFTRELYKNSGQVGIAGRTKMFGAFALAWITYPLRANDNNGLMFLNTDPNFLDVDDMSKLEKTALYADPMFQQWKKQFPQLDVWPGDRTGGYPQLLFARSYRGETPNTLRFIFSYPLMNGCHACARPGYANYWWNFDANGKFLGAKLISVSRVPPPLRRDRPRPPAPPAGSPGDSTPKGENPPPQPGDQTTATETNPAPK